MINAALSKFIADSFKYTSTYGSVISVSVFSNTYTVATVEVVDDHTQYWFLCRVGVAVLIIWEEDVGEPLLQELTSMFESIVL